MKKVERDIEYRDVARDILTAEQAAKFLQVSKPRIYALAKCKDFPAKKVGIKLRFSKRALIEWLERAA